MAKDKDKKNKMKGKKTGRPNAKIKKVKVPKVSPNKTIFPAPLTDTLGPTTSKRESNNNGAASLGKEKTSEKANRLSGFIFMCNPSTKLECYQYRVFGLPLGKKDVVEEIRPGSKLFLYDFELKLLYGIYEATCTGKLNLEPAAFRGKFPAQVKFKIFKECLPLPENSLRNVIKENYTGSKFKQELSKKLVKKLLSSFRPLTASSYQPAPHAPANVSLSRAMPPSAMGRQFNHAGRLHAMQAPYLTQMHYNHIPQHVQRVNVLPHGYNRPSAYVDQANPTLGLQSLAQASGYYAATSERPTLNEGVAHGVQEPSYSRYRTIEERAPRDQVTSLEMRYRTTDERAPQDQVTSLERRYLTVEERASHDQVTNLERHYTTVDGSEPHDQATILQRQYYQYPLQREAVYQDNDVAAYNPSNPALYSTTSSLVQPQVYAPYHPSPLQRGSQYQDSAAAYNPYPAAPSYQDNVVASYTASVTQPAQVLASASYYSYNPENPLSR